MEQPGEARPLEIQLGEKLTQVLKQGESKVELQLEPRNLGRVQVEMTWDQEGTLRVSMYAENSRTRTLLEQDLAGLRSVLSQNTQQEVRVEVSRQQESQQQNFYDGGSGGQNGRQQQEPAPRPAAEWAGFSASAAAGTRFPGRRNFFMERK